MELLLLKCKRIMSSRKERMSIRSKRFELLDKRIAARIFFKEESNKMYLKDLALISDDMTDTEKWLLSHSAWSKFFGRAYTNYLVWFTGLIKLDFIIPNRKGKIRAKDLIVSRVKL